ncbi:hypothetical protein [Flavobacterium ovatum]|uniref:hypothetical protein n=1 Tax=Flavobacterium ovatum TaxID=1928857 RepID=UPI00344EF1F9
MSKKKILWVVFDFVQAGGQRYVYEICKALDKQKYQIDILHVNDFNADKNWQDEYYYQPTLDLGCTIYNLTEIFRTSIEQLSPFKKKINKICKKLFSKILFNDKRMKKEKFCLEKLFEKYNYVNFSGIGVYNAVCISRGLHPANALINILTGKFQGIDIYKGYDKNLFYQFVSGFELEGLKQELSEFTNYKHTYLPLSLECQPYSAGLDFNRKKLVIGIFTRLSFMKPLDPYFYALKLLLEQGVDVELKVYGAGDPVALGFSRQLEYLYLKDRVRFCGHVESIPETLKREKFDLIWFQSTNKQLAGYAALEIALGAVPQVLWDFNSLETESPIEEVFKSFTNLTQFVAYTKMLLSSKELLCTIGSKQQQHILEYHSIDKNISLLEAIYAI